MSSRDEWRWADPAGQQRLVHGDELRAGLASGVIPPNAPVWRPGWPTWRAAHDVPALSTNAIAAAQGVLPNVPPPPLEVVASQRAYERTTQPPPDPHTEPPAPPPYVPMPTRPSQFPPSTRVGKTLIFSSRPSDAGADSVDEPPSAQESQRETKSATKGKAPWAIPKTQVLSVQDLPPASEIVSGRGEADAMSGRATHGESLTQVTSSMLEPSKPANYASAAAPPSAPGTMEVTGSMFVPPSVADVTGPPAVRTQPITQRMVEPVATLPSPVHPVGTNVGTVPLGLPAAVELPLALANGHGDEGPETRAPYPSTELLHDLEALKPKRPKWLVPALAAVGGIAVLGLLGLVVSSLRGGSSETSRGEVPASASSVAGDPSAAPSNPRGGSDTATAVPSPAPGSAGKTARCAAVGGPRQLSKRVSPGVGVAIAAVGERVAVAYAEQPKRATLLELDPSSLAVVSTKTQRAPAAIRSLAIALTPSGTSALVVAPDGKKDALRDRRPLDPAIGADLHVVDGALSVVAHRGTSPTRLGVPDGLAELATLDTARAVAVGDGAAFAARVNGKALVLGKVGAPPTVPLEGALHWISSTGPQLGAPSVARVGSAIVVAWAERGAPTEAWMIHVASWSPPEAPRTPRAFSVPAGGKGEGAMSPALATLDGAESQALLAWTEGPVSSHEVRAAVVRADGTVVGEPTTLSLPGHNAGQPAAIAFRDKAFVAYLSAVGKAFELYLAPLRCELQ